MANIVVAVDESEESMRACEWACKHLLSAQTNIQQSYNFILLHVQPNACVSTGPAYILSDQVLELLELQTKKSTQRILKRALDICDRYGVKAETHVVIGEAKERICEAAAKLGAHFLVVGSHGYGTFVRAIRGSVSDYCVRNATCPVVVVNKKVLAG
jgi:nucleotide-binding universal stress UspA family protein